MISEFLWENIYTAWQFIKWAISELPLATLIETCAKLDLAGYANSVMPGWKWPHLYLDRVVQWLGSDIQRLNHNLSDIKVLSKSTDLSSGQQFLRWWLGNKIFICQWANLGPLISLCDKWCGYPQAGIYALPRCFVNANETKHLCPEITAIAKITNMKTVQENILKKTITAKIAYQRTNSDKYIKSLKESSWFSLTLDAKYFLFASIILSILYLIVTFLYPPSLV